MRDTAKTLPVIYSVEQKKEMILAQLGKRGVFRGTGCLVTFIVEGVDLQPGHFNAKVATVDGIHIKYVGCARKWLPHFIVGGAWEYVNIEPDRWSVSFPASCWEVQFNETVCDVIAELYKVNPEVDKLVLFRMADRILMYPRSRLPF